MVSNQTEFNSKFPKESKQIELRRQRNFQGSLVIDDYLELESLNLRDIKSIEQLSLQQLPNLQEVTIWNCGLTELVIENCPQIKILNIRSNSLTNLNFLLNLENLAELDIEGNPQLVELLKPYKGDWKTWKEVREKEQQIARLQQEQTQFSQQEQEISYLEQRIQELTNLITKQKEKIISIFLRFFPQEQLVQELIILQLEYIRFKKQNIDGEDYDERIEDYEDKIRDIKKKLRVRLDKDTMNKIQSILTECENLVRDELDLKTKLEEKFNLIEEHRQFSFQLTDNPEENNKRKRIVEQEEKVQQQQVGNYKRLRSNSLLTEIEKAKLEGKAEAFKEIAILPRYNQGFINYSVGNEFKDNFLIDNINYGKDVIRQEVTEETKRGHYNDDIEKINRRIEKTEDEIEILKETLDEKTTKLVEKFIEVNKELIGNEDGEKKRIGEAKELHKKLKDKGFSDEEIDGIIRYCENLVDLEWQQKEIEQKLQTNIEVLSK